MGREEEALEIIETALGQKPDDPDSQVVRDRVLEMLAKGKTGEDRGR
jgi:hypothetical protein